MDLFLQGLVKLTAPNSLSFLQEQRKLFSIQEFKDSESMKQKIQPGDIVVTKTPSTVHGIVRKLTKSEYDHISIFLNKDSVIHIAPPQIRLISSNIFLMKKYSPIILRPNLSQEEIKQFLESLMNNEHDGYDYQATMKILGLKLLEKFVNLEKYQNIQNQKNNLGKRKICSDLVFYSLAMSSPKFVEILKQNLDQLDFDKYGNFTPDDMILLADLDKEYFKRIQITERQIEKVKHSKQQVNDLHKLQQNSNSKISQYFFKDKLLKNFSDDVKIIFDNPGETENFFVKTKSLIDKMLILANFNKIFSMNFVNKLVQYRIKQKQYQSFSQQLFGTNNDTADLILITMKIVYHLYWLKQIMVDLDTFMKNKSKFILHFGSLMLLINSIANPQSDQLNILSRISLPRL